MKLRGQKSKSSDPDKNKTKDKQTVFLVGKKKSFGKSNVKNTLNVGVLFWENPVKIILQIDL